MDFLDPKKKRIQKFELIVGYFLVGVLLILGTIVLLYLAYGFGLSKNGNVIQNGLVFISSTPSPATIKVNGQSHGSTDARVILESGQYILQLDRAGYRTWSRAFNVEGGSVQHFDYPFLIPNTLATKNVKIYTSAPPLMLESPDRRWLLVEQPGSLTTFDEFDLNSTKTPLTTVTIPAGVLSPDTSGVQSLALVEWSDDNRHVILSHTFNGTIEYITLDRQVPASSINLTNTLKVNPTEIGYLNGIYNQYYVYSASDQTLSTITLSSLTPKTVLNDVVAYKTYAANIVIYATTQNQPPGETDIRMIDSGKNYNIREVASGPTYLLDLAQYSGHWYLAVGASNENRVYIYQDPVQDLQSTPSQPVVPIDILKITSPNYIKFSTDTRLLMAEAGSQFSIFDALTGKDYNYTVNKPLDSPQSHATWMNGEDITLISGGKTVMFDFDGANQQVLSPAGPDQGIFFDQSYKYLYSIAPNTNVSQAATDPYVLSATALRTPSDL